MVITMEAYTSFAKVYDEFMDNIPYDEWCKYLSSLLNEYNVTKGIVLDMGCGTGSMTRRLSEYGYDMIGIDNSVDMLEIAREKTDNPNILFLLQDMREFELYGTVAAVVSICDSINYVTEYEDLVKVFKLVNNYLDPKGIFIFDVNTYYKYSEILADNTIAEDREDISFIWDNYFYEDEKVNEYNLSIFINEKDNLFRKFQETHYQRAYSLQEVRRALDESGMEFVGVYNAFTREEPDNESERVYFIAREKGK